jgi:DNA-binding MarR family transcriptional regulator
VTADPAGERLPLTALLSQVLVAFTIEFDNEFEHQMPHRTTRHGSTAGPGGRRGPWLVSMVMWSNCMHYVPDEGITVRELARRARITDKSMRLVTTRMGAWWGYLIVEPPQVRPTPAGRKAQQVWRPLTATIENRWLDRHGSRLIGDLRALLGAVASQIDVDLPDYPPAGEPRLEPATEAGRGNTGLALPVLLSRVLLALALDFNRAPGLPLPVSANVVRVLDEAGVRVRDVPGRAGVASEAAENMLGRLHKSGHVVVGPDPAGTRARVARLTATGAAAQRAYREHLDVIEQDWSARIGGDQVRSLRQVLERLVGDPAVERSPLLAGLQPYPDGWRASIAAPRTLPHYPLVLHRGGFPDGS